MRSITLLLAICSLLLPAQDARVRFEFVYNKAPFPSCHAATIVENPDGSLLVSWFGGTEEGAPDVAIYSSRRVNGAWSEPVEIARERSVAAYNPVLFYAADGKLWLYYHFGRNPQQWSAARKFSTDQGKSWSAVEYLPAGLLGPIKNKPLVLRDGTIVAGSSFESYGTWASWVLTSKDAQTWRLHGPVPLAGGTKGGQPRAVGTIQPAIFQIGSQLGMVVRTTEGRVGFSVSKDRGVTWSPIDLLDVPNPNSGVDAVNLSDGRVVMAYNPVDKGRSPLSVGISQDGRTWRKLLDLETNQGEYSYPALIRARDGRIVIAYTHNRTRIRVAEVPSSVFTETVKSQSNPAKK